MSRLPGDRLSPLSLAYRLAGRNFAQMCQMDIDSLFEHFASIERDAIASNVGRYVWTDLKKRLQFVQKIGLGHLQLGRYANTLSTGELQRIHLTVAMSSSLTQMLYVLDDPTSGLHPSESESIVEAMRGMKGRGNTVLVVSHDRTVLDAADFVIEMGPDAGERGGKVEFAGTGEQWREGNSLTASFWSGKRGVLGRAHQRRSPTGWLRLQGASGNNLKEPVVQIPLGVCCVVTGVSGSGKSSLVEGTLYEALRHLVSRERSNPLPFESLTGFESLRDVVLVDAQSIGRTPRSIPATALKLLDPIRDIFADTIDAKSRNLTSGYFSFNHALGKCRSCNGSGMQEVDMKFLADIQMICPDCHGSRFCREALQARYRDRTIAEVLAMTAEQAIGFFRGDAKLQKRLQTMIDVGLHYLPIGQPGNQLSHGESQRLKLASILANAAHSNTLFIMDEPTAGLHFRDVLQLIDCFSKLLDHGNSLLIVDHHDQLLMSADHVIELGPGSASHGGRVLATGTPEEWLDHKDSWASRFLSKKIVV